MRPPLPRGRWRRRLVLTLLVAAGALVLAQAVPYGRSHSNPPVSMEPSWDSPRTRALAARACFDCHSNLTKWRWYSNVAPVSWLIQSDVEGGRGSFNFSRWDQPQDVSLGDITEAISGGSMPPWFYTLPHPSASLGPSDKQALISGLQATFAASPPKGGGGG